MSYYALTLQSTLFGDTSNPAINVFTYLTSEITPSNDGAQELANAFQNKFLIDEENLVIICSEDTTFDGFTIVAPQVPTVLHVNADTQVGTSSTPSEARFITAEFYSPRSVGNIRGGFKRFGLMSEVNVTNGIAAAGGFTTALNNLADALSADLNGTVGGLPVVFSPIIVKRIAYTAPSGNTAYRLPQGLDPFNFAYADNWVYKRITTQNTRKR